MTTEAAEGLRPLLDSLSDGVCIADAEGRLLYANAAAGELLGLRREDAQGKSVCDLLCARIKDADCEHCPLKTSGGAEDAVTYEGAYTNGVGAADPRNLRVRCLRVRRPRGERHFLVVEDVRSEAETARRHEDWRHMFAHDLRSPLTNVLGVLRMIEEKGSGSAMSTHDVEMIGLAVRSCERIKDLLDAYLTVARMREGRMPVRLTSVDVGLLVRQCLDEESEKARAKGRTLECGEGCASSTPEGCGADCGVETGLWARADRELLHRALLNLLDNALKFTMTGGVVRITARREDGAIALRVEDDGAGIPAADLPHIFDRFYQAKGVERGVGFGLGLTFCREALRAMGGDIAVESVEGQGSAFTMRVPRAEPGEAPR